MTEVNAAVVARLRAAGCVFAEDEARVLIDSARDEVELAAWVTRRVAGEPLEPLVGWAEFCGLRVAVESGVFVPRRRTELLVHEAARVLGGGSVEGAVSGEVWPGGAALPGRVGRRPVVVDLCCGCGAVGAALAAAVGPLDLHGTDVDPVAVRCARRNLSGVGVVHQGDLDGPLPEELRGRVDVLVANAPYVPTREIALMPGEARDHEPTATLDGGVDGLAVHRRIARLAPSWLAPTGSLLIETSRLQAEGTAAAMARWGLRPRVVRDDEVDGTVVVGTQDPGGHGGAPRTS